ncbi:MAG: MBL fold metallo-hydrolase [Pirellulales bacterium]
MKVCIHRGTKEIGGTCVELESQGKRLVLDVGLPLDASDPDNVPLHPVKGFSEPDESLLGVVITHPHQDHYGLAHRLPEATPFLIGKAAAAILDAATLFSPAGLKLKNVHHLSDRKPIVLGPFTITPFLVDHSAYDSYSVLIEADGKRLFYTGDFRAHGRKASLIDRLVSDPPPEVDVLLMEGTCVGRADMSFPSEDDLVGPMTDLFSRTVGMSLVWCSGQNIDRIVTVFKACKRARRQFIIDMYTAEILRATGNERLPQADWNGIKVLLPYSQKRRIIREGAFEIANSYKPFRIYDHQLADAASRSVMLFRPSMTRELDQAHCLTGAAVVCSLWSGYLDEPRQQSFVAWMNDRGIPLNHCHTSGHASVADLRRMREAFPSAVAVPVHLQDQQRFSTLFGNVQLRGDGEWWDVAESS